MLTGKLEKFTEVIERTMGTMVYLLAACAPVYIIWSLGGSNPALYV